MRTRIAALPFGAELHDDGTTFRLWAPSQPTAAVELSGIAHAMARRADGWFETTVASARAGTRYAFRFPGIDPAVPDPASRWQPDGAHAASAVVDPTAYRWRENAWRGRPWHELVFYELHVGTFTDGGTYASAAERLDELVSLGITALELMPLAQPAGERNWGYDGVFPFAPQRAYGTPDELKALIDAAHARGLCVFLDVVYNHFGPEANYLHLFAEPFFTGRHQTPWGAAIDFDGPRSQPVREFFIQSALSWLRDYRFDGLRLDAVHEIRDESSPSFLDELPGRIQSSIDAERRVHLVLENDANRVQLLARCDGAPSYDAQWNDDLHHALHVLLTGERDGYYADYADEPARLLARALAEGFAYQGERSAHRGGATRGEPSAELPPTAFVDFMQNHDQIGNRAFGERISALAPSDAVRAASAVVLLGPAIPLLFMGEEWAASTPFLFFSDFGGELGPLVTESRRREFAAWPAFADPDRRARIPDPQDPQTMRRSTLRWGERTQGGHASMRRLCGELLALRRDIIVPRLARGARGDGWEVLAPTAIRVAWRLGEGARLELIANLGALPAPVTYAVTGAPVFMLGTVPRRAEPATLAPWSVGWFLDP